MHEQRHCKSLLAAVSVGTCILAAPALASNCEPLLTAFNRAVEAAQETEAQAVIDKIATSAECGQFQMPTQRRLAALRLSSAQVLMARGRPPEEFERLLSAAAAAEVLWQASANLAEVRFGQRRFAAAAEAYDTAIEIVKNDALTPTPPQTFEIEGLINRSAEARLLAANVKPSDGGSRFVRAARDQRDGTLGGIYSRSVRGIRPQSVPVPITFEYAKTTLTAIGEQAVQELAQALREQRTTHLRLVGHTDVRGTDETNMKLSAARAQAVAAHLKQAGIEATIETNGVGSSQPLKIAHSSGLTQEDIWALNRRVEFIRD